ncbi:PKD domain-containing protein [Winogradskyella pulchriflava]|uniref:PKD domain-containing protein n=1 Tax=Winogradskyella pulchriflava TaxID=1110688 RepID=A0ABV6Q8P6_9FLAO
MKTKFTNYFKYWCFIPILLLSLSLSAQEPCENRIVQLETISSEGASFGAGVTYSIAQSFIPPVNVTEIDGITLNISSTAPDVITLNLYEGDHTDGLDPVIASLTHSVDNALYFEDVQFQFTNTVNIIPGNSYYFSIVSSNNDIGATLADYQSYSDGEGFFIAPDSGPFHFDHGYDLYFSIYKCEEVQQEPCEERLPQLESLETNSYASPAGLNQTAYGQSFIVPVGVTEIDGITQKFNYLIPNTEYTMSLYEGIATGALAPVIASTIYTTPATPPSAPYDVHFQFSTTVSVVPGNSYYFLLSPAIIDNGGTYATAFSTNDPYPDGTLVRSLDDGTVQSVVGAWDYYFSIYKCDESIPTLEDLCNADTDAPVLKEIIATYPLTDLSDANGNNNTEIIPGVSISDTDGLCLDNAIVDNFDDLNAVITDPDVLSIIAGFDATPIEDNFDPTNFGVSLDFNLSYIPQVTADSDSGVAFEVNGALVQPQQNGIVSLGVAENPYLEFLGIVYNVITEQVGIYLESGDILYAETNVPLNEWHNVEVKYIGGIGRVFLDGELILWVDTNAIDTEAIDVNLFDVSHLTLEGALNFLASYASLGDGYEFCLKNVELYKCVPGATEVPAVTEECSVSLVPPTAFDNCLGTIVGTTTDPVEYTQGGDYVVNWSFDDGNGNVLELTQDVTVTTSPETDSDGDGVCDEFDICPGFDDNVDLDGNGIPDGCDIVIPVVDNCPNDMVNLALLGDATLSGSVAAGTGRGTPLAILYDPLIEDYRVRTKWNEYGVSYQQDLGTPDADNGFFWRVDWAAPKAMNYITIGGMYPNQPQPNALWRVSYLFEGEWTTLDEGQGGWLVNGIYEYDGTSLPPITADAMRIQVFSDGTNPISSIHLRGRGGISTKINDSATTPKATLFMYLPQAGAPVADFVSTSDMLEVDFDASTSTDDVSVVGYQWDFGDGTTSNAGPNTTHTYSSAGTYLVKLVVIDGDGLIGCFSKNVTVSDGSVTNVPDENINLALLDDATLSGSVPTGAGRGTPLAILYDPLINDYRTRTAWNEYGVSYNQNLGRPVADEGFFWRVDWAAPKAVNYVTIGGTYPNQPQPNALWKVEYMSNGQWTTLEEGQGGWIDSGIYEWDGTAGAPIIADAMRVQVYSDGNSDLVSIHLRGRGGISNNINDSATTPKATLFMYLPPTVDPGFPTADFDFTTNGLVVDFDASASTDDQFIEDYTIDYGDGVVENYSGSPTTFSHTYASSGTYAVTLTVVDGDGNLDSITKQVTVSDGSTTNEPDENTNLALLDDATVSGSVPVGSGRGTPQAILYDPLIDNYRLVTDWNEYGVPYLANLGTPTADNGFKWQVDWASPKTVNYVTFGGTYDSQPQYGASWRISYLNNGEWITLDEGYAGWINSGIFEWDGRDEPAIVAEAMRVQVYSNENDLISIHLRGRGGISNNIDDSDTETKATLIQYLQPTVPPSARTVEPANTMRISPNPSSGRALVSFNDVTEVEMIEIFDLTGRKVQEIKGGKIDKEGKRISVHALPQGIYNVIATTNSGEKHQTKLIIKK